MDKLKMQTSNKADENFAKLAALFPNVITETITGYDEEGKPIVERAIDKDVLMQEINTTVVDGKDERYQFTWPDKKKAVLAANAPISKTLRPCREESVNFDNTENLYIEGDNLEVLKLLQETYLGKIKMIYIDPPYNTGNDFVYNDDFAEDMDEYLANSGQFDEEGNRLFQNTESNGRFHTDWLNMIYPRLKLARDLLTYDGVVFISIDDNEQENLKKICDEIFGKSNFLATFPRITKRAGKSTEYISKNHEYILAYSKSSNPLLFLKNHTDEGFKFEDEFVKTRGKYKLNQTLDYDSLQYSPSLDYPIAIDGETLYPGSSYEKYIERKNGKYARADWAWRWSKELFEFGKNNGFIVLKKYKGYSRLYTKTYQNATIEKTPSGFIVRQIERTKALSSLEFTENRFSNDNAKKQLVELFNKATFDYAKSLTMIKDICEFSTSNNDVILDFFSGSATTAHAVMQLNAEDGGHRKFVMVQLPEKTDEKSEAYKAGYKNICEIGKERIRRAANKIVEENPESKFDGGFRVLKIDSTNMKDVYYTPAEFEPSLLDSLSDNIKEDRTPEDLLFQVMLDLGILLSSKIEQSEIAGKKIFNVGNNHLVACFDENVNEETITAVAKQKPRYFVMRDSSMANDSVATNFKQIFATYSPNTIRKVL